MAAPTTRVLVSLLLLPSLLLSNHVRYSTYYDYNALPADAQKQTNIAIADNVGMAKSIRFSTKNLGLNISSLLRIDGRSENPLKFHNDSARWGADGYYGVYCPGGPNVTYKGRIYKPKLSLCPDHPYQIARLVALARPLLADGTLAGIMLGDELMNPGLSPADLDTVATALRVGLGPDAILYNNFECCAEYEYQTGIYYVKHIPAALSIISIDAYDRGVADINSTMGIYTTYAWPALAPHQSVWLIPGALDKNDTAAAARAYLYWRWAQEESRVSGLMFFDWQFIASGKMPKTAAVWAAMGECVRSQQPAAQCTLPPP